MRHRAVRDVEVGRDVACVARSFLKNLEYPAPIRVRERLEDSVIRHMVALILIFIKIYCGAARVKRDRYIAGMASCSYGRWALRREVAATESFGSCSGILSQCRL